MTEIHQRNEISVGYLVFRSENRETRAVFFIYQNYGGNPAFSPRTNPLFTRLHRPHLDNLCFSVSKAFTAVCGTSLYLEWSFLFGGSFVPIFFLVNPPKSSDRVKGFYEGSSRVSKVRADASYGKWRKNDMTKVFNNRLTKWNTSKPETFANK